MVNKTAGCSQTDTKHFNSIKYCTLFLLLAGLLEYPGFNVCGVLGMELGIENVRLTQLSQMAAI